MRCIRALVSCGSDSLYSTFNKVLNQKYNRETEVCFMSQPWSALPQVLAADVAGRWPGIFVDGVPSWLTESGAITPELLAAAIASSPFLAKPWSGNPMRCVNCCPRAASVSPPPSPICNSAGRNIWRTLVTSRACIRLCDVFAGKPSFASSDRKSVV